MRGPWRGCQAGVVGIFKEALDPGHPLVLRLLAGAPKEGQETYGGVYAQTPAEQGAAEAAGYSYAAARE